MAKKLTLEDFISKAKIAHGEKYDYSDSVYFNSHEKIAIKCKLHGLFYQKAYIHYNGHGCSKCGEKQAGLKNKNLSKDKIDNKTKKFIEQSKLINGNNYNYSQTYFTRRRDRINIICKKHGLFTQYASNHLKGHKCSKCYHEGTIKIKNKKIIHKKTREDWINEFNKKYNNLYKYRLLPEKFKAKDKIEIICEKHNIIFEKIAKVHRMGVGCPECTKDRNKLQKNNRKHYSPWRHSLWEESGKKSKQFKSFKVYLVRMYNQTENFFKIGKTYLEVKSRFTRKGGFPYNFELLKVIESHSNGIIISKLEKILHRKNKEFSYKPNIQFQGETECFSYIKEWQIDLNLEEENVRYIDYEK